MNRKFLLKLAILFLIVNTVQAQSKRRQIYDSLLVGDKITPIVSSVMMPKGYTEIILSNSMFTTNSVYNSDGESLNLNNRITYLFNTLQVTYGASSSARFNVGLDVSYRTGRADSDPESSPWKVFGNSSEGLIEYERGLTSIGLRARYVPTRNRNFVIQNTFVVPFGSSDPDNEFLGDNRYAFNTQFLYTYLAGRKVFLFGQTDVLYRFKDDRYESDFTIPINLYCSYILNRHLFPFIQAGMVNSWNDVTSQWFTFGAGLQYQFNTMFNINVFYNDVFAGTNVNRWNYYNLGIRVVL
jgi:hypothetical protein